MTQSQAKIDAIYGLRDAVEARTRLEAVVDEHPTADAREALLDATLEVEAKTQHAIDVCHECGHVHAADRGHGLGGDPKVIRVNFRPDDGPERTNVAPGNGSEEAT
jgi:hypothetical protein